ncbi:MAG: DUF4468 domain-containing protein [Paludibacteraceae bacterium]|nr:DUF4468 domain-containing protein [Paludibacteraceae bacterium]
MKKLIICALAILMATTMHAQGGVERLQVNEKSNLVTFTQVVENPSKDKTALFSAVKTWIATTYNSAKTVTDLADENTGKFILKPVAILPLNATVSMECKYLLTIAVKDGKARIVIDNIRCDNSFVDGKPITGWGTPEEWKNGTSNGYKQKTAKLDNVANVVADHMEMLLRSFDNAIRSDAKDDEW